MKNCVSLFACMLLTVTLLPAVADESFEGTILDKNRDIRVKLSLPDATPSNNTGSIRFEGSWVCTLTTKFVKVQATKEAKVVIYSLQGPPKGRCISLMDGSLRRSNGRDGSVILELFRPNDVKPLYTIDLDPPGN